MTDLRPTLPPLPKRFTRLPVDGRGFPVPAFVAQIDGEWDFRVVRAGHLQKCLRHRRCWLCGEQLGKYAAFVIGPMCIVNRISSEAPSHLDCARFAVEACPFLANPDARRNERALPTETSVAGNMIKRNPGVTALVTATDWRPFNAPNGILIRILSPFDVEWWAHGRNATRSEVLESLQSGLPFLREVATAESPAAVKELESSITAADKYLPGPDENLPNGDNCPPDPDMDAVSPRV